MMRTQALFPIFFVPLLNLPPPQKYDRVKTIRERVFSLKQREKDKASKWVDCISINKC